MQAKGDDGPALVFLSESMVVSGADADLTPTIRNNSGILTRSAVCFSFLCSENGIAGAGAVAQLGEHLLCKQGVAGSIPVSSTK